MTSSSRHSPTGEGPVLREVPRIAFEIQRTIAVGTAAGFGPGYTTTQVTLISDAALELQRHLGMEKWAALTALAMLAVETDQGLLVEDATRRLVQQSGWSRQKTGKILGELESAGFVRREQVRTVAPNGRMEFGVAQTWLSPAMYATVLRKVETVTTEQRTPATVDRVPVVTKPDNGKARVAATSSVVASSVVTEADNGADVPAQTVGTVRDNGETSHLHGDEDDYELHRPSETDDEPPSPATPEVAGLGSDAIAEAASLRPTLSTMPGLAQAPAHVRADIGAQRAAAQVVLVQEDREPTTAELRALLTGWRVLDAEHLLSTTPREQVLRAVRGVQSRLDTISNPGAYMRRLLQQEAAGSLATAAAQLVPARGAPARPKPEPADEIERPPDGTVGLEGLEELLAALSPAERADVEAAVSAALDRAAASWGALKPTAGLLRGARVTALAAELRRRGHLANEARTA